MVLAVQITASHIIHCNFRVFLFNNWKMLYTYNIFIGIPTSNFHRSQSSGECRTAPKIWNSHYRWLIYYFTFASVQCKIHPSPLYGHYSIRSRIIDIPNKKPIHFHYMEFSIRSRVCILHETTVPLWALHSLKTDTGINLFFGCGLHIKYEHFSTAPSPR